MLVGRRLERGLRAAAAGSTCSPPTIISVQVVKHRRASIAQTAKPQQSNVCV